MSVIFETQKSIYARLTGDAPLMALISGVYDFVPQVVQYPYVTIGDIALKDDSVLGLKGFLLALNVNVYSQSQGRSECLNIIERVKFLLDGQALAIAGFSHVYSKVEAVETARAGDNVVLSGQVLVSILVRVI